LEEAFAPLICVPSNGHSQAIGGAVMLTRSLDASYCSSAFTILIEDYLFRVAMRTECATVTIP
jgi:hypothetical protein